MAEGKYSKYIHELPKNEPRDYLEGKVNHMMVFDNKQCPETDLWFSVYQAYGDGGGHGMGDKWMHESLGEITETAHAHEPPGDEIHLFFGSDPNNIDDLGGEVDIWLGCGDDAEKFTLTKRTAVFIPGGLSHSPFHFRKVNKGPIFQVVILKGQIKPVSMGWIPEEIIKLKNLDWENKKD